MRTYHHFNLEERERFFAFREQGLNLREIGRRLDRPHSSFSRELGRNTRYGQRQRSRAPLKNPLVFLYCREHLRLGWTPEEIAGRLPVDYPGYTVNKETIYRLRG